MSKKKMERVSCPEFNDAQEFYNLWMNNGQVEENKYVHLQDAIATTNAAPLLPKVFSNIVKEAQEPLLVGTSLLNRIEYKYGPVITFPAMGAIQAGDVAEGMEYPEKDPAIGGSTVTATIGKSGVAVAVTEEMLRYSQFDVIGMLLRAAGAALARWKEQKIFRLINAMGYNVFDNLNPRASFKGVCTGRDISGAGNGSVTADDIFDTYSTILMNGFYPDVLLMHPLTWSMFAKDPVLRTFALSSGGGVFFAGWQGRPDARAPWDGDGLGVTGGRSVTPGGNQAGLTATTLTGYDQTITSAPSIPGYINIPFRIIVTPMVPFDPTTNLTDIYMCDSSAIGAYIVDEEVTTEDFDDPVREIRRIKLRERYALAVLYEGKGVGKLSNVHVVPNKIVLPAQSTVSITSEVGPLTNVL